MRKRIFVCVAMLISIAADAQSPQYVDSLRHIQVYGKTDSIRSRVSYLIGDHFYTDFEKAKKELDKGLSLSRGNRFLEGLYHFYLGGLYYFQQPEKAIDEYGNAISLLKAISSNESLEFQARAWHNMGAQYQYQGNPKRFMEIVSRHCIPLAKQIKSEKLLAQYNYIMGILLMNTKDFQPAESYFAKSLLFYQSAGNAGSTDHLETLIGTAKNFLYWGKLDSTKKYLDLATPISNNYKGSSEYLNIKELEANYYIERKDYRKAELLLKETIQSAKTFKDSYDLHSLNFQLYNSLFHQGKYGEAKAILERAKNTMYLTATNRLLYFSNMAKLYNRSGDYRTAYRWMEQAYELRDSTYNEGFRNEMNMMEKKYRVAEKEKEISQLQAEKKEAQLAQKNQRLLNWLLGIGALVILLTFILGAYIYRTKQKQTASRIQELQRQKELDLTQAMLNGEERERQRIARDLHDGLGGALSGIKIKLFSETKDIHAPVIDETILQLEHSIGELRRIARNMMPETLVRSGLEAALQDICYSLSSDSTFIEFQSGGIQPTIPLQYQVNIYRIVQELLANAIRHGAATRIIVQCIQEQPNFLITVEDNGKGFDPANQSARNGIGLENIRNRIMLMNGTIQIDAAVNEGTTVNIELHV